MNFQQSIEKCLKNYANFNGRAKRSELWFFYLFVVLVSIGTSILDFIIDYTGNFILFNSIATLALLIPQFSAGSRRLHDIGKSGWWQLIGFTGIGLIPLIIWLASEGSTKSPIKKSVNKTSSDNNNASKLRELNQLYKEGVLTKKEFTEAKKKYL